MKLSEIWTKISGKAVVEPHRQTNWNFPLKEYVQSKTVYTIEDADASNAIKWIDMTGGRT